jgi:4-hydroxythreonine-4-phosphate dehydrogenase
MKLMGFDHGVGVLGGFSVPICTPAHGTAYDIAGTARASSTATLEAFLVCRRLASMDISRSNLLRKNT